MGITRFSVRATDCLETLGLAVGENWRFLNPFGGGSTGGGICMAAKTAFKASNAPRWELVLIGLKTFGQESKR